MPSPLRPWAVLLVASSLSIGWGIRGNYGHELGAMFPGTLAAIAACLVSNRADWHRRVAYFALFGGMGWAFGGSISYMQVIGYTHSGHLPSQAYGFAGLYLIGFLWGALGGAGTAVPAVLDRQRLQSWFGPLTWFLAYWAALYMLLPVAFAQLQQVEGAMRRQESAVYWFDSDWIPAAAVLLWGLVYDLVGSRFKGAPWLAAWGAGGAAAGWLAEMLARLTGLADLVGGWLVRPQGDTAAFPVERLVTNWPNFFGTHPEHVGWLLGLAAGLAIYGWRNCRPPEFVSLAMHLAGGWLAAFLAFPVLLGIRLTPPRSDDWAGILGAVLGLLWFCRRADLPQLAWAALVSGTVGGLGFSGIAALKLVLTALGNPRIVGDPAVVEAWHHWQSANWHSFLEQSYGWVNGLGIALVLGLLARRTGPLDEAGPRHRWTEVLAVTMALPVLLYVNMIKNLRDWSPEDPGAYHALPARMKAPLWPAWEMSADGWFTLFFALAAAGLVGLMMVHLRRPLAVVPATGLGRGQLLYLVILWSFVVGNFGKALPGFNEQRLLTEGFITFHAVLATWLVLTVPREREPAAPTVAWRVGLLPATLGVWLALAAAVPLETALVRRLYGDQWAGHSHPNYRFGPQANWRMQPVLKGELHR